MSLEMPRQLKQYFNQNSVSYWEYSVYASSILDGPASRSSFPRFLALFSNMKWVRYYRNSPAVISDAYVGNFAI